MSKYTDKANQFIKDADAINKFVNGTDSENVTLPNGETTSSMRKLAKDTVSYLNDPANHYTKTETDTKDALVNTHAHVMTKAEFEALAAHRREEFAGSGFVEWGRSYATNIQNGMYIENNSLLMGRRTTDGIGNSPTNNPIVNVNGNIINISGTNYPYPITKGVVFTFPDPNLPTIESDSSNLSKDYKQGDNILLNDTGVNILESVDISSPSSWYFTRCLVTTSGSGIKITVTDTSYASVNIAFKAKNKLNSLIMGVKYKVRVKLDFGTADNITFDYWDANNGNHNITPSDVDNDGWHEFELTATHEGSPNVLFGFHPTFGSDVSTDDYCYIQDLQVIQTESCKLTVTQDIPAGTNVYTDPSKFTGVDSFSRQDLVFLESWYEDVAEKDIVYPYGNVQYIGGNTDGLSGIVDGSFTGADTYSLFGNWQNIGELVGKGYVWGSLSEEDKRKFASNPENNIYLDGEKYIQVRYRIRVVKGLGNNWDRKGIDPTEKLAATFGYISSSTSSKYKAIELRGKTTYYRPDIGKENWLYLDAFDSNVKGIFLSYKSPRSKAEYTYNNELIAALPIALVQRRNQGIYHPVYNNEGCAKVNDGGTAKFWYESSLINSVEDCFDHNKIAVVNKDNTTDASNLATLESGSIDSNVYKQTGLVESTVSGRPDGLYADEVNERDVEDLRMGAHKVTDYKGYLEQKFNDAVAGKIRGKEKDIFLKAGLTGVDIFNAFDVNNRTYKTDGNLNDAVLTYKD